VSLDVGLLVLVALDRTLDWSLDRSLDWAVGLDVLVLGADLVRHLLLLPSGACARFLSNKTVLVEGIFPRSLSFGNTE
jgi:hypothetical protein